MIPFGFSSSSFFCWEGFYQAPLDLNVGLTLSSLFSGCSSIEVRWIYMMRRGVWMSANDLFIHGGNSLSLACPGDCELTDICQGEINRKIRLGAMCFDLQSLAQLILPDGVTFRSEAHANGAWNNNIWPPGVGRKRLVTTNQENPWQGISTQTSSTAPRTQR